MAPSKKREKNTGTTNSSVNASSTIMTAAAPPASPSASSSITNGNSNATTMTCGGGGAASIPSAATTMGTTNGTTTSDSSKMNGHQQEQELFLQAFEKPTQIYRFLRNRHATSPIFLNRTLSYMKDRMSRTNKNRGNVKVDNILESVEKKLESDSNKYLAVIFNGLLDKSESVDRWWNDGDVVCVEVILCKITKSKRKESTSDFQEVLHHSVNVVCNPHENIDEFSTVTLPMQSMLITGDQHTMYKILFRIHVDSNCGKGKENEEIEGSGGKRVKQSPAVYGCELSVYEKNVGFIPAGDYEAALQELNTNSIKSFSPKKRTWESLPDNYIALSRKFDVFNQFPTLKFRLTWSSKAVPATIAAIDLNKFSYFAESQQNGNENSSLHSAMDTNSQINHNNNCVTSTTKKEKIQIVYNFVYSNNTRQQTEYTQEVICPWCGLDCLRLYALLKHLKLCHPRFNFTYQPAGNGARIDVTINDSYDGSYAGSPYDLAGPSGSSFARTCGPVRRTTVTNLLVCRPRRQKTSLTEFLVLDENELSNQRPYITGHNRLYHHTETCLPVHPKELDIDSEGESDPLWLRQKTIQMIDEFSDVNEGEKELMKLWNLHVMKHGYVGDCQLPLACEMFLDDKGHEIIRKNLYRNFMLHMSSLFDYGLVSPETVYKTVQKLQELLSKYPDGQALMSKQRESQLKYWVEVGINKQDGQKLKSPQKQLHTSVLNQDIHNLSSNANIKDGLRIQDSTTSSMIAPTKRSVPTIKRSNLSNHNANVENMTNGANKWPSKNVVKKSASPALEMSAIRGAKRTENGLKRNSTGTVSTSSDATLVSAKRRFSERGDSTQGSAHKRSRNDAAPPANSAHTNGNHSLTRSIVKQQTGEKKSTNTASDIGASPNDGKIPANSKKIISRRRSIHVETATETSSKCESGGGGASLDGSKQLMNGKKKNQAVRTRHSLQLTKIDKR